VSLAVLIVALPLAVAAMLIYTCYLI